MSVKYFYFDESPITHKYMISPNHEKCCCTYLAEGSYNILPARLLGISYADYLRLCRDELGADIIGKNALYPVAYFKKTTETELFLKLLNSRMKMVMWEREHPDWKEHEEYVREYEREKQALRRTR